MNKISRIVFQVIFYLFFFNALSYSHLCDHVFLGADKLIVKPEIYNLVVRGEATFKIFLQNNVGRTIDDISLTASSPAFDFKIAPKKMRIPKGRRVFFIVTMKPKPNSRTGNYPIRFRLVKGKQNIKSFNLDMQKGGIASRPPPVKSKRAVKERIFEKIKDASRLLQVKPTSGSSKIDGIINDGCWKEAAVMSNFSSQKGGKAVSETVALITFDKKYLYFGIHGEIESGEKISKKDEVEIRLATSSLGYPYYSITLRGVGLPRLKMSLRKGNYIVSTPKEIMYCVRGDKDFWTAELSIPFSALKTNPPTSRAVWYMRIIRTKVSGVREVSYWSQDSSGYNSEEGFGAFVILP